MRNTFLKTSLLAAVAAVSLTSLGARPVDTRSSAAVFAERVLELTNKERAKAGLGPLSLDPKLCASAAWKAEDMAERNYFEHQDRPGHNFIDRDEQFGYSGWLYLGENLAAGQKSPEEVVQEWMASPGHRRNILKPEFKQIGIAYTTEDRSSYKRYWVQEFGTR